MARISFNAKIYNVWNADGESVAYQGLDVPAFKRAHCDMSAFRSHPKYGGLANSDLFPNVLARIKKDKFPSGFMRLDKIPEGVLVDQSGFLAQVSFDV